MLISITELRCKNIFTLFPFIKQSIRALNQAKQADGNEFTQVWFKGLTGYTLTIWRDKESMMHFRKSGEHQLAMKKTASLAKKYRSMHYESAIMESKYQAYERLKEIDFQYVNKK